MATDQHPLRQPTLVIRIHIRFGASHTEILHRDPQGSEQLVLEVESYPAREPENSGVRPVLRDALEAGIRRVVVDLTDVIVLSSVALAEIIDWHNMIARDEGALVLCNPTGRVAQTLAITKLDEVFEVVGDMQTAQEKLRSLRPA